jgi:hypothetical protein
MSRWAVFIFLTCFPLAPPAQGQAIYHRDPPAGGEQYRDARPRHPQFRGDAHRGRHAGRSRGDDSRAGQDHASKLTGRQCKI